MISENINCINKQSIIVCDPIKNSVLQYSNFYKIIYSNDKISLNGLFVYFELKNVNILSEKIVFDIETNKEIIDKLSNLEEHILNILKFNKNKNKKITEFINNGYIKYCYNDISDNFYNYKNIEKNIEKNIAKLILKISGIWESGDNIGLTFKIILIKDFIEFYPSVEKKANNI